MRMNMVPAALAVFGFLIISPSFSAAQTSADAQALMRAMHPQTGTVSIANGIVQLNVGPTFRYLNPADTTTFLTKVLGNPASSAEGNQGAILPTGPNERWFAVLAYSADGHVSDSDAASINYNDLLQQIRKQGEAEAKARRDGGLAGYQVLG